MLFSWQVIGSRVEPSTGRMVGLQTVHTLLAVGAGQRCKHGHAAYHISYLDVQAAAGLDCHGDWQLDDGFGVGRWSTTNREKQDKC